MDVRIAIETTVDNGEKRTHQFVGISRLYRVTCPEGFGLRLEDGKRVVKLIQRAILCDQVEEITLESRVCPTCASVRAIHGYRMRVLKRSLGGFKSEQRAYVALPVIPGQRQVPEDLFLRWLTFCQTEPPRSCSGSMPNLGPGIPFAKPRG